MNAQKDKEDIVEIFLLIKDEEIERAVNKMAYIKSPKKDAWRIGGEKEGM